MFSQLGWSLRNRVLDGMQAKEVSKHYQLQVLWQNIGT